MQGPAGFGISRYDPCKLFSQQQPQMQAALQALLEEPQNNLQAFVGGAAVGVPEILAIMAAWSVGTPREVFAHVLSLVLLDSGQPLYQPPCMPPTMHWHLLRNSSPQLHFCTGQDCTVHDVY